MVDFACSFHVAKMKKNFVEMKVVKVGNHKLYMKNNTYCDVFGIGILGIALPGLTNFLVKDIL